MILLKVAFFDWLYYVSKDLQILPVLVASIGLVFLIKQLSQINHQNALTEKSIRQTYRPFGIFYGTEDALEGTRPVDRFYMTLDKATNAHTLRLYLKCSVSNGVLWLRAFDIEVVQAQIADVRTHILQQKDLTYQAMDLQLTNGEHYAHASHHSHTRLSSSAWLYVYALYEDHDSNLYGSVLGLNLRVIVPFERIELSEVYRKYISFTPNEKKSLEMKFRSE